MAKDGSKFWIRSQCCIACCFRRLNACPRPRRQFYPRVYDKVDEYKMWKMTPREKISQALSYLIYVFYYRLRLIISGATYPGVPHLIYTNYVASVYSASPKSTITGSTFSFPAPLIMIFSSLISRCMIFFLCRYLRPINNW